MDNPPDAFSMRDVGFAQALIGGLGLICMPWIWKAEVASRTYLPKPPSSGLIGDLFFSGDRLDHHSWWLMKAVHYLPIVFVMFLVTGICLRLGKPWSFPLTFLACGIILIPYSALLSYVQYHVLAIMLCGYTVAIMGTIGIPPIIRLIREMK